MAAKTKRTLKSYTLGTKRRALATLAGKMKTLGDIAKELGCDKKTIRDWRKAAHNIFIWKGRKSRKMVNSGLKARFPEINSMLVSRIKVMMELGVPISYDRIFRWLSSCDLDEMKEKPGFKPFKASRGWYLSLVKRHHWSNRVFTQTLGIPLQSAVFECCKHILAVRHKQKVIWITKLYRGIQSQVGLAKFY